MRWLYALLSGVVSLNVRLQDHIEPSCNAKSMGDHKKLPGCDKIQNLFTALNPLTVEWEERSMKVPFSAHSISEASRHSYDEHRYRLQRAAHKLLNQNGLNIFVVGGSLTQGKGCRVKSWVKRLAAIFEQQSIFDPSLGKIKISAAAAGGATTANFLADFHELEQQMREADIVISELQFNEQSALAAGSTGLNASQRQERSYSSNSLFISKVMSLPNKPAFLFLDIPSWFEPAESLAAEATSSIHWMVANHFHVPLIWYSDAVRASGELHLTYNQNSSRWVSHHSRTGAIPFKAHPYCFAGHNVMASLVLGTIFQEMEQVCEHGVQGEDTELPALSADLERMSRCYSSPLFMARAVDGESVFEAKVTSGNWSFFEDVPGKPGWIATPGADQEILFEGISVEMGILEVEYLQSYTDMGEAECRLEDQDGNVHATPLKMNGRWDACFSISSRALLNAVPKGTFNLRCRSLGRKFKITGLLAC